MTKRVGDGPASLLPVGLRRMQLRASRKYDARMSLRLANMLVKAARDPDAT